MSFQFFTRLSKKSSSILVLPTEIFVFSLETNNIDITVMVSFVLYTKGLAELRLVDLGSSWESFMSLLGNLLYMFWVQFMIRPRMRPEKAGHFSGVNRTLEIGNTSAHAAWREAKRVYQFYLSCSNNRGHFYPADKKSTACPALNRDRTPNMEMPL